MTCLLPCLTAGDISEYVILVSERNTAVLWRHEYHMMEQAHVFRDLGPGWQEYLDSQGIFHCNSLTRSVVAQLVQEATVKMKGGVWYACEQ